MMTKIYVFLGALLLSPVALAEKPKRPNAQVYECVYSRGTIDSEYEPGVVNSRSVSTTYFYFPSKRQAYAKSGDAKPVPLEARIEDNGIHFVSNDGGDIGLVTIASSGKLVRSRHILTDEDENVMVTFARGKCEVSERWVDPKSMR